MSVLVLFDGSDCKIFGPFISEAAALQYWRSLDKNTAQRMFIRPILQPERKREK